MEATMQGYAGTVTNRGKRQFVKFGGGLTKKWDQADVFASPAEAMQAARSRAAGIWNVPGYVAIDESGSAVEG